MENQLINTETEYISKEAVIDLIEKVLMAPTKRDGSKSQAVQIYEGIRTMSGIRLIDFM